MKNPAEVLMQKRKEYNQAIALVNQQRKELEALALVIPMLREPSDPEPEKVEMP